MQPHYNKEEVAIFLIAANIIVVVFAVFFFLIIRIQQKRKQFYQKQLVENEFKTREESFLQISRDLHDEIGSSLSGINMLSQLAQQHIEYNNTEEANRLLSKINIYTSEVIEKVSDMVWLLKPNEESITILLQRLKTHDALTARLKNIKLQFDNSLQKPGKELSILARKAIYLISKEAINNAVKYAECENIFYSARLTRDTMTLCIMDDGKGFDINQYTQGNGLKNMQVRAEEIGAVFSIQSIPNKGTTIKLLL